MPKPPVSAKYDVLESDRAAEIEAEEGFLVFTLHHIPTPRSRRCGEGSPCETEATRIQF